MSLVFENVAFSHPAADSGAAFVFSNASFAAYKGAYIMVRGESGAGKSTLLRLACRLELPDSGRILFHDVPVEEYHPPELRRRIAYVPQTPAAVPGSVRDNLLLPFSFGVNRDLVPPSGTEMAERLESFRLDPVLLDRNAEQLSTGQLQRVCLIRTLLMNPEMLLMDEPASALDRESADVVMRSAEMLNRDHGVSVMVVTHTEYAPDVPHTDLLIENRTVRQV